MTQTEQVTRNSQAAIKITCTCSTHTEATQSAVMVGRTEIAADRIHGWVLLANHPVAAIRARNERKGVYAA